MTDVQTKELLQDNYEMLLFNYAAGNLDPAQHMIVLSHTMLNDSARHIVGAYENIGAALVENQDITSVPATGLEAIFDKIEKEDSKDNNSETILTTPSCDILPQPIFDAIKVKAEDIKWKKIVSGIEKQDIKLSSYHTYTELLRLAPGKKIAPHTHKGQEITLILDGSFEDESGIYKRGDMIVADETITHAPSAGQTDGCICVSARTAPLHFKGLFGRFINPLMRH